MSDKEMREAFEKFYPDAKNHRHFIDRYHYHGQFRDIFDGWQACWQARQGEIDEAYTKGQRDWIKLSANTRPYQYGDD